MSIKFLFILVVSCVFAGCSNTRFKKDQAAFEASATIQSFKSVEDMNDSYFDIRENNFFEFYKLLYDSVKNTRMPGRYSLNGDTMLLQFYNRKGTELLGSKALVSKNKKEIVFFDHYPGMKKRLVIN